MRSCAGTSVRCTRTRAKFRRPRPQAEIGFIVTLLAESWCVEQLKYRKKKRKRKRARFFGFDVSVIQRVRVCEANNSNYFHFAAVNLAASDV